MVLLPLQARQDRLARALVAAVVRLARRLHGPQNWQTHITHTVVTNEYILNKSLDCLLVFISVGRSAATRVLDRVNGRALRSAPES